MRALAAFLLLFGLSGWALFAVSELSGQDKLYLVRNDPERIDLRPSGAGTWTLCLWSERRDPPTLIEGFASGNACLAARRKIFADGVMATARCRQSQAPGNFGAEGCE